MHLSIYLFIRLPIYVCVGACVRVWVTKFPWWIGNVSVESVYIFMTIVECGMARCIGLFIWYCVGGDGGGGGGGGSGRGGRGGVGVGGGGA